MYQVELNGMDGFSGIFSSIASVGRSAGGLIDRGREVIRSGVVQDIVSDAQDVGRFFGIGSRVETVQSPASTTPPVQLAPDSTAPPVNLAPTPTFQTRTSLARQQRTNQLVSSAKLPLLLGAGGLVAILLLRK